jgi:lysophospholipase L1-like esterase
MLRKILNLVIVLGLMMSLTAVSAGQVSAAPPAQSSASWTRLASLSEPNIASLAVSGSTVFAGAYAFGGSLGLGGVYRSPDGGVTWNRVGLAGYGVVALAISDSAVFAGTDTSGPKPHGIYRSQDNGNTWSHVGPDIGISSLEVSGTTILAGTSSGLYRSADGGGMWTQVGMVGLTVWDISASGSTILVSAGSYSDANGIFRSTDDGISWSNVFGQGASLAYVGIFDMVALASSALNSRWSLYRSADSGLTWNNVSSWPLVGWIPGPFAKLGTDLYSGGLRAMGGISQGGIYRSEDNGVTWELFSDGLDFVSSTTRNIRALVASEDLGLLFTAVDGQGVWVSIVPTQPTPMTIALEPMSASLFVGQSHTVTATVTDPQANPQPGVRVTFSVDAGPNASASGTCSPNADCTTETSGQVSFTYTGTGGIGVDQIKGCFADPTGQTICSPVVTAEWTLRPIIDYFALGDSIASGHGLLDGGDVEPCRRSTHAYPNKVMNDLKTRYETVNFYFLACSGATVRKQNENITDTAKLLYYKWLTHQVDYVLNNLSQNPTLVTITIGANDLDWSNIDNVVKVLQMSGPNFYHWKTTNFSKIHSGLLEQLNRLLEHQNVAVVITNYYNPFNTRSFLFDVNLLGYKNKTCLGSGADYCYFRLENAVLELNKTLVQVRMESSDPSRVQIASAYEKFRSNGGHESPDTGFGLGRTCGNSGPYVDQTWIQYVQDPDSVSFPTIPKKYKILTGTWRGDCFHPREEGAAAIADIVNESAKLAGR